MFRQRQNKVFVLLSGVLLTAGLFSQPARNVENDPVLEKVLEKARQLGVPPIYVRETFSRPEVARREKVIERFNAPYEAKPYDQYRKIFITPGRIEGGVVFLREKRKLIDAVSRKYGVDPFLLVSLAGVESNYGNSHKEYSVFNALYTIAYNYPRRSSWAAGELAQFLSWCYKDSLDPFSIYGSYAGAFGFGQFIPSSYNHYAVDFDGDGVRRPYDWPDVLGSMANYLVKNGYDSDSTDFSRKSKNWKAIYAYNHSENYVNVILELREEIKKKDSVTKKP